MEAIYQECWVIGFQAQGIPFLERKPFALQYRGQTLRQTYKADFICCDKILFELKALSRLTDEHRAQTLNYLYATGIRLGLLLNFGHHPKLEHERFIIGSPTDAPSDFAA